MLGFGYEKCVRACRVAVNESEQRKDVDLFLETDAESIRSSLSKS